MNHKSYMIFFVIISIPFAQQFHKRGIGFEFHTFPTTFLIGEVGSVMGVYFPFETTSGIFIEPLITHSSSSSEIDYDYNYNSDFNLDYEESESSWGITLGIFKSKYLNKMRTYGGIRVGKVWIVEEETNQDDYEWDALIISPTFGVEYFINENFSFGGEAMYSMLSSENKEDDSTTTIMKSSMIIPKFMVRFYF